MTRVISADGTAIAFEKTGNGSAVILVDGALCYRGFGPMRGLAALLASNFTVYTYDRRGRGESGDTHPYVVAREVEDIAALVDEAGGSASLCGLSSGAALALEAARTLGDQVTKLALYEAPYNDDAVARQRMRDYTANLAEALAADRRGDAVALFMNLVGAPDEQVNGMRHSPVWTAFEAVAPTLAYDNAILGDGRVPVERAASVAAPTLVMNGGASHAFMQESADALARVMPNAQRRILAGQRHDVASDVLAPILADFFGS